MPSAGECLVCCDPRDFHFAALMEFNGSGVFPPCLPITNLRELLTTVIYDQFFCAFPIAQTLAAFHRCRKRKVVYCLHCHCSSPNSMQCMLARFIARKVFYARKNVIKNDTVYPLMRVCCNSWSCVPVKSLGSLHVQSRNYFFIVVSSQFLENVFSGSRNYIFTLVKLPRDQCVVVYQCDCGNAEQCGRNAVQMFNSLRLVMSCSFADVVDVPCMRR